MDLPPAWPRRWPVLVGFLVGLLFGFFLVLGPILTDGPRDPLHPERLAALALAFGAYFAAALLLAVAARWRSLLLGFVLAAPGFGMGLSQALRDGPLGIALLHVGTAVAAAWLGNLVGLRLRRRDRDAAT